MKKIIKMALAVSALCLAGNASAVPFTTGLTLSHATTGTNLCPTNCYGTITIDGPAGGVNATTNGTYDIVGVNIVISPTAAPILTFGDISDTGVPHNFVQIVNGAFTSVYGSVSTNNDHLLSFNGSDWNISGLVHQGGGSGTSIPEPGSVALLGIGLAGLGFAMRKRRRNSV